MQALVSTSSLPDILQIDNYFIEQDKEFWKAAVATSPPMHFSLTSGLKRVHL